MYMRKIQRIPLVTVRNGIYVHTAKCSIYTYLQNAPLLRGGQLEGLYDQPRTLVLLNVCPDLSSHCWVPIAVYVIILNMGGREGGREGGRGGKEVGKEKAERNGRTRRGERGRSDKREDTGVVVGILSSEDFDLSPDKWAD